MPLDSGGAIGPISIAYETYGTLNGDRSNAVLVCHALTGDQFCAGENPITGKPGWWTRMVGPGKPVDTDRYFVICSNILGGCMGSTGPQSIDPETGNPYGIDFPVITIGDMARAQKLLIDHLGIARLFAVIGGSMGGMNALQWAVSYPGEVQSAIIIATAARHTAQNIAFNEVGRQAILSDPEWLNGDYQAHGKKPASGLGVARMAAHITYLSKEALQRKFGRNLQDRKTFAYGFDADFQVESYLRHQGNAFVNRFDANSYLYITRAMDYFDLPADYEGNLARAFCNSKVRFCIVAFSSDWLFPPEDSHDLVMALNNGAADASFVEIETDKGHDAFLLDEPEFYRVVGGFIEGCARKCGLADDLPAAQPAYEEIRPDLKLIADLITPGSQVLDVGSGDGSLLAYLARERSVNSKGLELSREGVRVSVAKGLSVIHGDANRDLLFFGDNAFDYVVLSQTLQSVQNPRLVLEQLVRIGKSAIVSFNNFGYWRTRGGLLLQGRNPIYGEGGWWNSDVIHPFTIDDFLDLAASLDIEIRQTLLLNGKGGIKSSQSPARMANLLAREAVFLLARKQLSVTLT